MPITLYPIQKHSDLEWKVRIDGACDIYQEHYHTGWAYMARYAQQQETQCTIVAQHNHLDMYAREVKALKL
jgi:chromosome segregation ATPase